MRDRSKRQRKGSSQSLSNKKKEEMKENAKKGRLRQRLEASGRGSGMVQDIRVLQKQKREKRGAKAGRTQNGQDNYYQMLAVKKWQFKQRID